MMENQTYKKKPFGNQLSSFALELKLVEFEDIIGCRRIVCHGVLWHCHNGRQVARREEMKEITLPMSRRTNKCMIVNIGMKHSSSTTVDNLQLYLQIIS